LIRVNSKQKMLNSQGHSAHTEDAVRFLEKRSRLLVKRLEQLRSALAVVFRAEVNSIPELMRRGRETFRPRNRPALRQPPFERFKRQELRGIFRGFSPSPSLSSFE